MESPDDLAIQSSFLNGPDIPSTSEEAKLDLEKKLDVDEISNEISIVNMKGSKAAGPIMLHCKCNIICEQVTTMPISIMGRINIVKITILPKCLYVFLSIPLAPPPSFFPGVRRLLSNLYMEQQKRLPHLHFIPVPV